MQLHSYDHLLDEQFMRKSRSYFINENDSSYRGLLICGSGVGMSIAANKIKGIRAANVVDELTATTN